MTEGKCLTLMTTKEMKHLIKIFIITFYLKAFIFEISFTVMKAMSINKKIKDILAN
jgi:hypothetical protein